jgi:hypothetical protein
MNDYYKPSGERPRIYGAVINVVLAMGYRVQICRYGDITFEFNDAKIKTCVDNAQMMLDELMTRDQDTLGLQALLGLVSRSSPHNSLLREIRYLKLITCFHVQFYINHTQIRPLLPC